MPQAACDALSNFLDYFREKQNVELRQSLQLNDRFREAFKLVLRDAIFGRGPFGLKDFHSLADKQNFLGQRCRDVAGR